jgi:glycosyltransferase involved in cell wall biosynthesis
LKILIFTDRDIKHPWGGGSLVNIHEQAKRWARAGHEVTMISMRPRGHSRTDEIDGVKVFRAGNRFTVFLLAPLLYLCGLRRRADVVIDIINGIPFGTPLFCRKPKVAIMHHVHRDMFLIELGPVLGRLGRFIESDVVPAVYRNVPFMSVSESSIAHMRRLLRRGDRLDITLVYNGIDHEFYRPDGEKFDKPTVLYLGRVKRYKRIPRLIRMVTEVRRQVPEVELIIAGGGDAFQECINEIAALDAGDYVKYRGWIEEGEKLELYRRAWVMATPSLVEGWGLTVIEANACGTTAVAFDAPGLRESIVDGVSGLLASDDAQFTECLARVLTDGELRHRLEAGAVLRAREFSWDKAAAQAQEVLEEAIRRKKH